MEQPEKIRLDILNKIRCRQVDSDTTSSDSEQETESGNSFGTPRSGTSDIGTPRSSDESSAITSPRANLLWDHGFDVAKGERLSPEGRDTEWRRFNKTDDDKINADRRMKIQEIAHKLQEINETEAKQARVKHVQVLPDLIPSASLSSSVRSSQETLYAVDDLELPPPLPNSDPPIIDSEDSPPPLPTTSPPKLTSLVEDDSHEIEETFELKEYESDDKDIGDSNIDSDDTNELCNENPYGLESESDVSSSAAGDLSDQDYDERETDFDGCYNVQTNTLVNMNSDTKEIELPIELTNDVEAEFDFILQSLDANSESQETYIERFAGRRDRYGFILSPVVEAPSPTPSNLSGYSGYSGISCSSPDPFGVFRMSPGPNRGSKQEIDLSSLCVKNNEWNLGNEQTVPIYQTVQAKRALVIPEGYGWESGDDLLSPTGSGEWDCSDNGLCTPPVSTTFINLTQFGTHITGFKQPDVAIYEEPENCDSDTTIEDDGNSDTDTTIDEDSPRDEFGETTNVTVKECDSPEKSLYHHINDIHVDNIINRDSVCNDESNDFIRTIDESIQTLELSELEEEINAVENELKLLKIQTGRNGDKIQNVEQELNEIKPVDADMINEHHEKANADTVSLESSLNDSCHGFSAEVSHISQSEEIKVAVEKTLSDDEMISVNSSLDRRCRNPILVLQKHVNSTTDDESDSTESYEDAEDEYSDSGNENDEEENKESDFELFRARPIESKEKSDINASSLNDKDEVSVTELLTPRSAILKSGGMFPDETDSCSLTSDEDVPGDVTPDANMSSYGSGIKISQYTSGDSDDNGLSPEKESSKILNPGNAVDYEENSVISTDRDDQHNSQIKEDKNANNREYVNSITTHNTLDFSILNSRPEASNRVDLRKSPRIFGRYYAEMGDELLEEVRSKRDSTETPKSKGEFSNSSKHRTASSDQRNAIDLEDLESSFQNVEISNSSDMKFKKDETNPRTEANDNVTQTLPRHKYIHDECNEREIQTKREETLNVTTNDIPLLPSDSVEADDINLGKHSDHKQEESNKDAGNKSNLSSPRGHRSDTLKLKISHLVRRGSARSKVKHGYVHELSELFDKSTTEHKSAVVHDKKKSKRQDRIERPQTPKIFTPNENIVIYENNSPDDPNDNIKDESLGFEVTPMQKVKSFEPPTESENESLEEDGDNEHFEYLTDENKFEDSDSESDTELKMYEDQLREKENDFEVYDNYSKGEATLLEDDENDENGGTKEFMPELDTLAEIYTPEQSLQHDSAETENDCLFIADKVLSNKNRNEQEEIEENIVGDIDPNQSEDEEFHEKYFLPGHPYYITGQGNGSLCLQNNENIGDTSVNTFEFVRPPNEIIIENAITEVSSERSKLVGKESERADDSHEREPEVKREDIVKTKDDGRPMQTHVDISSILRSIPLKTLKQKKQGEVAEEIQRSQEKTKNAPGYMYDVISRINMEPISKTHTGSHLSDRSVKEQSEKEVLSDSELKETIMAENQNSEYQGGMQTSHPRLNINETSKRVIEEDLELKCLGKEPAKVFVNKRNTDTTSSYIPRKRHVYDHDEDPKFKIRYPSSLSRRLYGPYCRLRSKQETEYEGEANPPGLASSWSYPDTVTDSAISRILYDLDVTGSPKSHLHVQNKNCCSRKQQTSNNFATDAHDPPESTYDLSPAIYPVDNSSIYSDDRRPNPDTFNHTCYAVKTPFSTITQHDSISSNLKAIIGGERNQAQPNTPLSEKNFVNVNLQQGINEAKSDKQECDFKTTSYYDNRNYDVKFTKLPMHLECKSLNSKCGHENRGEINYNNLGVDVNTVAVKNDDHYTTLGVHIPSELSANETKQENVDMNNDLMSSSHKINSVETKIAGINNISTSVTTQNISSPPMSSGDMVTDDKPVNNEDKESPEAGETHISRASVVLQTPGFQHVLEDEKGKLKFWPYSDFENSDKLPVTLHRVKKRINLADKKGMSNRSSNMTVIQSAEHSAEMPENRVVQKYHSSSILPGDRSAGQIMKAHGESVQSVLLQDKNGNNVSEEELAAALPKIADSISKMENSNAEEILPGITQSITKLKNGGNLVITTMTRKLDEDESSSSGRGSPEPEPDYPVLNVDDLENSKIYLVQDSKGELFYVEDVTSETQESAYFSSRNTSECVSDTGNSPTFERISKINSVGDSGIKQSTAQEILTAMYGDSDVKELTENEEEWSERTYEYDIPRRRDSETRKNYSKDSFKTSYMVEEPGDTLPKLKSATSKDRYESSYQMSGGSPWVYDGGMSQSYSQMTQGVFADETNSVSAVSAQNVDNSGVKTIERYTIEGEAIDYPAPQPVFVPPMVVHTDIPQYSMVKVDVTPKHKDEGVMAKIEAPKPEEPVERPIYKTVATITTPEKVPSPKPVEKKKYKIIASKATEKHEEEQETHMRFDEIDYKFTAENVEYKMRPATTETQYFIKNTSNVLPQTQFRTEKRFELGNNSDQKYKSQIQVQEPKKEVYEQSSYSYDQMKSELEQSESNMRVVRGSYLIKNTLDNNDVDFDDNINMFDGNFNMYKDNPLYKSDEDLYKRLERERIESARRQERLQRDLNQDISFETVDRFSKSKTVKREPEKPRQSLYELLLSRLSTIDAKHIRQNIDVKHNHEDIYGDPRFLQADGEYIQNVSGTNNFDSVGEKVDLMLKEGKAFITVRVTAERITPVDLEFNVWRKNQAIVTRTIEVDLLATQERRRLYYKVMEEPTTGSRGYRAGPNETVLDSQETLDLFTKILGAADGEGDNEDIEVKTRSGKTTRPFSSGMDLLY